MPKFSIIVPLYNKAAFVEETLKRILSQTEKDYEVIIVNDASTDDSVERVQQLQITTLKWVEHTSNRGLAAARNSGIQAASGEYITFLDADDVWEPNFLKQISRLQSDFPEAKIFATNYWEWFGQKLVVPHNSGRNWDPQFRGIVSFFDNNIGQGLYNHGSVCFHRSVFNSAGNYNEDLDFSEDIDFNIRANFWFQLAFYNQPCMRYRMAVTGQMTSTKLIKQRVPDFKSYREWELKSHAFKKYLDFERYVLAKKLKLSGRITEAKELLNDIEFSHLNQKQRFLVQAPAWLLVTIGILKIIGIRIGIKLSSY